MNFLDSKVIPMTLHYRGNLSIFDIIVLFSLILLFVKENDRMTLLSQYIVYTFTWCVTSYVNDF